MGRGFYDFMNQMEGVIVSVAASEWKQRRVSVVPQRQLKGATFQGDQCPFQEEACVEGLCTGRQRARRERKLCRKGYSAVGERTREDGERQKCLAADSEKIGRLKTKELRQLFWPEMGRVNGMS